MEMTRKVKQIYNQFTQEEKINFLRQCHLKLLQQKYDGRNKNKGKIQIKENGQKTYILVSGKSLKGFNDIYIRNYATDEERKQYISHCEEIKECYEIVIATKGVASEREQIARSKGLNYSKEKIMFLAHKYCYVIKGMSELETQQELMVLPNMSQASVKRMPIEKQKLFLKKCHYTVMHRVFNGSDSIKVQLTSKQNGTKKLISIQGRELKELNKLYLKKYATEKEKKTYTEYCKMLAKCYNEFKTMSENDKAENSNLEKTEDINENRLRTYAYKFCYLLKGMNEQQVHQEFKKDGKYDDTLRKIMHMSLNNPEEIIDLLRKESLSHSKYINLLKARIFNFLVVAYPELNASEKTLIQEDLERKIKLYMAISAQERKDKAKEKAEEEKRKADLKLLPIAQATVIKYLSSGMTIKEFDSDGKFVKYLSILKEYDPTTYQMYAKRDINRREDNFNNHYEKTQALLFYLKNGIQETKDTNRPFDMIDYYLYIGVEPSVIDDCIKHPDSNLGKQDYIQLRRFISAIGTPAEKLNLEQAMNSKLEINSQRDENGWPIVGTGRVITIEEKQEVINFLCEHNIPVTTKLYDIALRRYINSLSTDNPKQAAPQLTKKPNKN